MKARTFSRVSLTLGVLALFAVSAPAVQAAKQEKGAKAAAAKKAAEPLSIQLHHSLSGARAEALKDLVERFNAQSKNARVHLSDAGWRDASPHLLILDGDEEDAFVAGKPRFKPLHALMKEAGAPLQSLRPPTMMTRTPVDARGRLLALPVGMSTPVLFLNRDSLRQAGLNPDKLSVATWTQLQETLGQLVASGHSCPYTVSQPGWVMVENLSAWHNAPVAAVRGKVSAPSFNGMFQVKHVAMMASWARANYLQVYGNQAEAESNFAAGKCAVIAAPSASWVDFRGPGKADIGVTRLPYHDDFPGAPQNTVADGPALWASAGKKKAEYAAMASFISFWLKPENQVSWQRQTGYLPLNRAGLLASHSELQGDDLDNVRVAVEQLNNKPTTTVSAVQSVVERERVRRILDEELAGVWADTKAAKEALDNAVARASESK